MKDKQAAFDIILKVLKGANWDAALSASSYFNKLEGRDRGSAFRLAAGTLKHYNLCKQILPRLTGREALKPVDLEALCALGLTQILFLDVAEHAAVNSSVDLAMKSNKGLVNAVLRRATREKDDVFNHLDIGRHALPNWLFEDLVRDYGEEAARAISLFCLKEPALDLTLKSGDSGCMNGVDGEWHSFDSYRLKDFSNVKDLPGYEDGNWWIQDAAAALPVRTLGDLTGKTALDICAAPGGKSLQLAAQGAQVTALDISEKRLLSVEENALRCGLADRITTIAADAKTYQAEQAYDVVLLDAPCSASGTIRRHPDMWVQAKPRPLDNYLKIQSDLLTRSADWVKAGGVLLYATCSLDKREGEAQIESFLKKNPPFLRATPVEKMRILPHENATDGFFFCALQRQ